MKIREIHRIQNIEEDKKLTSRYALFEKLINELNNKEIPLGIVNSVNQDIEGLNSFAGSKKDLLKQLRKAQSKILSLIEKELKLVTRNHYRNRWLALGMSVFGIPLGVAFGASLDNMAFLGIGLPIGMAIGMAVGTSMDKKASENGNQLDLDIEH